MNNFSITIGLWLQIEHKEGVSIIGYTTGKEKNDYEVRKRWKAKFSDDQGGKVNEEKLNMFRLADDVALIAKKKRTC